jgi:5-methylcytosine-specific restriction protein A
VTKVPRLTNLKPRLATLDTRVAKPLPKEADAHYLTPEHRAWALEVKQRAGWRCQHIDESGERCPNRHPTSVMYADHIVEIKDDPSLALERSNGACKCASHNVKKGLQARSARMAERF